MKKKLSLIAMTLALVLLFCIPAFAMTPLERVTHIVDQANMAIEQMVNQTIASQDPDIGSLVEKTDKIADQTIEQASVMGVEVVCEIEYYDIDGQRVAIDPLKVVN